MCRPAPLSPLIEQCTNVLQAIDKAQKEMKLAKEREREEKKKQAKSSSQHGKQSGKGKAGGNVQAKSSTKGAQHIPSNQFSPQQYQQMLSILQRHSPKAKQGQAVSFPAAQASPAKTLQNDFEITPDIVNEVLEKMYVSTQSVFILLGSLKDQLKKGQKGNNPMHLLNVKNNVCAQLKKAMLVQKRSISEVEGFVKANNQIKGLNAASWTTVQSRSDHV